MRKTKIICTLGPATDNDEILRQLMLNGMDVARINMSHQDHETHKRRIDAVKKLREELGLPVALLLDTKGPEIRTGNFNVPKVHLEKGQTFTLTTEDVVGDETIASISFKGLPQDVTRGSRILIDDGLIELRVMDCTDTTIVCTVVNGGFVSSHKSINVPGVHLSLPFVSEKDKSDLEFAVEQGFDFIAASFTRSAEDLLQLKAELHKHNSNNIRIIAKIENADGVDNIDDIINIADGIMVARGDLGVEIPLMIEEKDNTDELFDHVVDVARQNGLVHNGDLVVITAGIPLGVSGTTNMLKVHLVGDVLASGTGVNNLTVCGNLCVCRNEKEARAHFKPGDILVIPQTSNNLLDIMKDASGIITEAAGINSHAAIVGMALDKPVIVGAENATKLLRNGTTITLDAQRGIVFSGTSKKSK